MFDDARDEFPGLSFPMGHGVASNVPALLRALTSSDAEERTKAIEELHQTVIHQGTIDDGTIATVPFLLEYPLAAPAAPMRPYVAFLLALIADGRGYYEVHARGNWEV